MNNLPIFPTRCAKRGNYPALSLSNHAVQHASRHSRRRSRYTCNFDSDYFLWCPLQVLYSCANPSYFAHLLRGSTTVRSTSAPKQLIASLSCPASNRTVRRRHSRSLREDCQGRLDPAFERLAIGGRRIFALHLSVMNGFPSWFLCDGGNPSLTNVPGVLPWPHLRPACHLRHPIRSLSAISTAWD